MEIYLQKDGQQTGPYTEEQLRDSVTSGTVNQFDLARHEGLNDWQPLCTIIEITVPPPSTPHMPAPTSGTPHLQTPQPPTSGSPHLQPPPPPPDIGLPPPDIVSTATTPPARFPKMAWGVIQTLAQLGALIGGWACFVIGFIVLIMYSWPFYIHFTLFVAAVLLSIEALSQRKIIGGLSLLFATLMLPTIVGFGLLFYRANKAAEPISDMPEKIQVEK